MSSWQLNEKGLELVIRGEPVDVRALRDVKRVRGLTAARARELLATVPVSTLLIAATADEGALSLLRAEKRSYHVRRTRETYLAPEVDQAVRAWTSDRREANTARNPFATRASRVPRVLLLHPETAFTVMELSRLAKVDKSLVSRTVTALAREGHVSVTPGSEDERLRCVRLNSPRRLLEEWSAVHRRRRSQPRRFDIGTRTVAATLRAIVDSAPPGLPYAISGLAGAQFVSRVVEPADVLLLTTSEAAKRWTELLLAEPAQGPSGLLRLATVDDEFLFELAERKKDVVIADPAQLWLDTASAGERSREASDAIAKKMHW